MEEKETGYLVFMYECEEGVRYLRINSLVDLKDITVGKTVMYKRKVNKATRSGEVYEHEFIGDSVYRSKRGYCMGYWRNQLDVASWEERNRQYKASKQRIKALEEFGVKATVAILREIYKKMPYNMRSAFIAKVVEEIVK